MDIVQNEHTEYAVPTTLSMHLNSVLLFPGPMLFSLTPGCPSGQHKSSLIAYKFM